LAPPPPARRRGADVIDEDVIPRISDRDLAVEGDRIIVGGRTYFAGAVTAVGPRLGAYCFVRHASGVGWPEWSLIDATAEATVVGTDVAVVLPERCAVPPPPLVPVLPQEYQAPLSNDDLGQLRKRLEERHPAFVDDDALVHLVALPGDFSVHRYQSLMEEVLALIAQRPTLRQQQFSAAVARGVPARSLERAGRVDLDFFDEHVLMPLGERERAAGRLADLRGMLRGRSLRRLDDAGLR
jgi:hypothetical protein